ncbi:peptidoglycan DD-metalloendopeptidase family protein [Paenibacillus aurantius]|uniref:Peptidoglycan DD-metalloendopeptidase family protein n=1 Tax=Paenibacillus aurantius TaxID=2918900 RepID=A0AA96RFU4_9BACL|nr:peptidoglycan DD-metalloendopeptidase family protein [Paenibacillus aurantius]WNQ11623.1 peptidoglycan DD-metalloendopeptidase family protein [Paenibacillus aurantius]
MKRQLLSLLASFAVLSITIQPGIIQAGAKEDIDRQLRQLQQQEQAANQTRQSSENLASQLRTQKDKEKLTLDALKKDIADQGAKLNKLNGQITTVTGKVKETGKELEDAEDRVASRDKMLKSRVKLMYMNGSVSYVDVLLSANSFSDFIDRFNSLKDIVGQDKKILDDNKKDRNLVAEKKKQVEQELKEVQSLYAQAEAVKQKLMVQEKQKEVVIASLNQQEQEAEDHGEEAEANLIALAKQKAALYQQKNEILKEEQRQAELKRQREAAAAAAAAAAASAKNTQQPVAPVNANRGGQLGWPVPSSNIITSEFGYRMDPIKHVNKLHKGMDIGAPNGSTIVAADDGIVLISSWVNGYGNTVVIDHGNGMWTWYGHIREGGLKVSEGETVKRGQKIAEVGSTGDSTGNHLHFEVRIHENPVNPRPYVGR